MITTPEDVEARILTLLSHHPELIVVGEDGGIVIADRESKVRFRIVAQNEPVGCSGSWKSACTLGRRWF